MAKNLIKKVGLVSLFLGGFFSEIHAMQAIFSAIRIAIELGAELGQAAASNTGGPIEISDFDAQIRNDLDQSVTHQSHVDLFNMKILKGRNDPAFSLKNEQYTSYFNLYQTFCFKNYDEQLNPKARKDFIDANCPGRWPYVPWKPGDHIGNYPSSRFSDMLIIPRFPKGLAFGDPALSDFLENEKPEHYYKEWAENTILAGEAYRARDETDAKMYSQKAKEALKKATGNYSGNRSFNADQMKHIQEQQALAMQPLEERAKKVLEEEGKKIASIATEASTDWEPKDKWPDGDKGKWWTLKPRSYYFEQYAQFTAQAKDAELNRNTAQANNLKAQAEQMAQLGAGFGNKSTLDGAPPQAGSAPLSKAEVEKRKAAAFKALMDEEHKKGAEMKEDAAKDEEDAPSKKQTASKKNSQSKAPKKAQATQKGKKEPAKKGSRDAVKKNSATAHKSAQEEATKKAEKQASKKAEEEAQEEEEDKNPEQTENKEEDKPDREDETQEKAPEEAGTSPDTETHATPDDAETPAAADAPEPATDTPDPNPEEDTPTTAEPEADEPATEEKETPPSGDEGE